VLYVTYNKHFSGHDVCIVHYPQYAAGSQCAYHSFLAVHARPRLMSALYSGLGGLSIACVPVSRVE